MRIRQMFWWTVAIFAATVLVFEWTDLDVLVQNQLFDRAAGTWLIDAQAPLPRLLFYDGVKWLLIAAGSGAVIAWLASYVVDALRPQRPRLFFLILCMGLIPLVMATGKRLSNVFCPADLTLYGGNKPYVRLFEAMPKTVTEEGRCWPAGHASGGFSLMALFFLFRSRRQRILGLAAGFLLGWLMGLYQMAKGAHFLSHTLVTMELAWLLILALYACINRQWRQRLGDAYCGEPCLAADHTLGKGSKAI